MEELVFVQDQQALTTSKKVAWKFQKEHKNVIRAIENIECSDEFAKLNFERHEYQDVNGFNRPEYIMTRDGFVFLAMGFTGKKAAKLKEDYINMFNQMEQQIKGNTTDLSKISRKDLAKMLWEAEEEKEKLEKENQEMLPKAEGYDKVVSSDGFLSLKEAANSLGYGRQKFIDKLRGLNVLIKQKPLPYQRYIDNGYFTVKDKVTGNGQIVSVALVSSKGIDYIFRKLNETEQQKSLKIV